MIRHLLYYFNQAYLKGLERLWIIIHRVDWTTHINIDIYRIPPLFGVTHISCIWRFKFLKAFQIFGCGYTFGEISVSIETMMQINIYIVYLISVMIMSEYIFYTYKHITIVFFVMLTAHGLWNLFFKKRNHQKTTFLLKKIYTEIL